MMLKARPPEGGGLNLAHGNQHLSEVEALLQKDMESFESHVEQLCSIYGISTIAACAIIAEIGTDMSHFKTAEHICS